MDTPANTNMPTTTNTTLNGQEMRDYLLNSFRSTERSKKVTSRKIQIGYKRTSGGLRLLFDHTTFNGFKEAAAEYYTSEDLLRDYTAQIISVTDAAGEPVECKVKVKGRREQKDSYTVNLFITTASALINGKALDGTFEKKHLPQIASKLNISENSCKTEQTLQQVTDMLAEVVAGNAQSATESSLSAEDQATKSPDTESSAPAVTDESRELVEVSGNKQSATESSLSTEDQAPGTESSTPAQTDENREPISEMESNTEQNTNHGADNSAIQDPEVDFPGTQPLTKDSTSTSKSTTDIAEILATLQALENKYTELLTHQDTMRDEITTLKTELAVEQEKTRVCRM